MNSGLPPVKLAAQDRATGMPKDAEETEHGEACTPEEWRAKLQALGDERGFFRALGDSHSALFVERGDTLIVTFENLDHVYQRGIDRMPWGYSFVEANGWSMLGLMAHGFTWYRDSDVYAFFDELRDNGFFDKFRKVVFYGASMGGYAAAAFSSASPGATVIAISPQATLRKDIAPWETRYRKAWRRDFSNQYGFAPDMVATASEVYLFYDPLAPLDAMHAALFSGDNVSKLRCRYFGHRIATIWVQMGVLKTIIHECVDGTLNPPRFYALLRRRRDNMKYQRNMLARLQEAGRPDLVVTFCEAILARRRAPKFRQALRLAQAQLRNEA